MTHHTDLAGLIEELEGAVAEALYNAEQERLQQAGVRTKASALSWAESKNGNADQRAWCLQRASKIVAALDAKLFRLSDACADKAFLLTLCDIVFHDATEGQGGWPDTAWREQWIERALRAKEAHSDTVKGEG